MNPFNCLITALDNLRVNKLRSALTMLGVIIGVSAVIVMVSLVEGARSRVVGEFERLGARLILVIYDPDPKEQRQAARLSGLTMDDVHAIRIECSLIREVCAEAPLGNDLLARYSNREAKASVTGVQPDYCRLRNVRIAQGRFFTGEDMRGWARVCVIGPKVRRELFPPEVDPLGADIFVRGIAVTVVGVLESKGRSIEGDPDRAILLPITSVQKRFLGRESVGTIWAQPLDTHSLDAAMDQIWQCLMRRHNNTLGFRVDTLENIQNAIGRVLTLFGLVLGGIAGLALLVGGIGIMNIMLVSVTERTREIGLRKAVGARRKDILWQFLIESAALSGSGGVIGIALGAGAALTLSKLSGLAVKDEVDAALNLRMHLPLWAVLGAFTFSVFVGVFFGLYPAVRAARLDPIQALRHE